MTPAKTIRDWYESTNEETRIKMFEELHLLKQGLCSQTLGMPTGEPDWIDRSIVRVRQLIEIENRFRHFIHEASAMIVEAQNRTQFFVCQNCMGRKLVHGDTCCICRGTGLRNI